ncbi:MAG: prepilin-type N-terminal cleavage/methylation domain-containing protein [Nitrospinae bacterium]|nr:prepilin-type N-terminal cleavage/methylation domain-containing protein [Nitrospinota bacterium]
MKRGFGLLELVAAIAIAAIAGASLAAPLYVAAKSLRGAPEETLVQLARGEMEMFLAELSRAAPAQWAEAMQAHQSASPAAVLPAPVADGVAYNVTRAVECLDLSLAADAGCAAGFARVTVTAQGPDAALSLSSAVSRRNW